MNKLFYLIITIGIISCSSSEKNLPDDFDFGKTEDGLYSNKFFNLEVSFDSDWNVQDKQQLNKMVELGNEIVAGDNQALKSGIKVAQVNTAYLLSISKYKFGAAVESNPMFMIVAENINNFPGIENGKDYLFHAKKLISQTQLEYSFDKDIYQKNIGNSTFYVMEANSNYMGSNISQHYFTTISKGFSLSFILSYSTEEERIELYNIMENIKI